MAETSFTPPPGPPPPKVPEGWKAVWNDQYKEWFFVNLYTKVSQWDKPTEPVYPPGESSHVPPDGPPPSYNHADAKPLVPEKSGLSSNNPYAVHNQGQSSHDISEDEKLARQLQDEENARGAGGTPAAANRGAADSYYNQQGPGGQPPFYGDGSQYGAPQQQQQYGQPYGQAAYGGAPQLPPRIDDKGKGKGGFLGKLLGKKPGHGGAYPPQQQYYGGAPQGQYGYGPQQGYYPQQAHGGKKSSGPGMGAVAGGAALGVGAGLLGGALIADAADDGWGGDGGDFGGDGGDFGGGDFDGGF